MAVGSAAGQWPDDLDAFLYDWQDYCGQRELEVWRRRLCPTKGHHRPIKKEQY